MYDNQTWIGALSVTGFALFLILKLNNDLLFIFYLLKIAVGGIELSKSLPNKADLKLLLHFL